MKAVLKYTPSMSLDRSCLFLFVVFLLSLAAYVYRNPGYDIDVLGYMGNALVIEGVDIVHAHAQVYSELKATLPKDSADYITGERGSDGSPNLFRLDRSKNPYHYGEFLPYSAIRPLYNELISVLHRLGLRLIPAIVLVSVSSLVGLGLLGYEWLKHYLGLAAMPIVMLLVVSPPILNMARYTGPDAFSTLIVMTALYLIFEKQQLTIGCILLLASIYARNDNAILVVLVLVFLGLTKKLRVHEVLVLLLLTVGSQRLIDHFAGHYSMQMMYHTVFVHAEAAPGEFVAGRVSLKLYLSVLRAGITGLAAGPFIPYLLMGTIGFAGRRSRPLMEIGILATMFACLHFILFPLPDTRYLGAFYMSMGLLGASAVAGTRIASKISIFDSNRNAA